LVSVHFPPRHYYRIEGTFPAARYFAFETYDMALQPISFLRDARIRPLGNDGNPFAEVPTKEGKEGVYYRLFLTKDGKRGFPNEMAVAKSNFAVNGLALVVLRLYGVDPGAADFSLRKWEANGFVPPLRVSTKVMG
jgi:hypothetical protein